MDHVKYCDYDYYCIAINEFYVAINYKLGPRNKLTLMLKNIGYEND